MVSPSLLVGEGWGEGESRRKYCSFRRPLKHRQPAPLPADCTPDTKPSTGTARSPHPNRRESRFDAVPVGRKGALGVVKRPGAGNLPDRDQFSSASQVKPGQGVFSTSARNTTTRALPVQKVPGQPGDGVQHQACQFHGASSSGRRRRPAARPDRPPVAVGPRRCRQRRRGTPPPEGRTGRARSARVAPRRPEQATAAARSEGAQGGASAMKSRELEAAWPATFAIRPPTRQPTPREN